MNILKETRKKLGLTQDDMAIILGKSVKFYADRESGKEIFNKEDLSKILKELDINEECLDAIEGSYISDKSILKAYYSSAKGIKLDKCIYFLKDCNRKIIKIGITKNLDKRMMQIYSYYKYCGLNGNDLKLIGIYPISENDYKNAERELHNKFDKYKTIGEWFKISEHDFDKNFKILKRFMGVNIYVGELNSELYLPVKIKEECLYQYEINLKDKSISYEKYKRDNIDLKFWENEIVKYYQKI